jgi:hypothetical protein
MKRKTLYLVVALITLFLGVSIAFAWLTPETNIESPLGNAVDVDYYKLAAEPEMYVGKNLRLRVVAGVGWKGSLIEGLLNEPTSIHPVFFGVIYAPESQESFAKVEGTLGIDPEDPKGSINSLRRANVILSGKFIRDTEKSDSIGRRYPYWFVINRLEYVEGKAY